MSPHEHNPDESGHTSHDHSHTVIVTRRNRRRVGLAALLTGLFVIVELIGGLISGSLALLADAGHMLTDFGALSLAWAGFVISQRPATPRHTYGFGRTSILVAFVNGLSLFVVASWIVWEAIERLNRPGEILAGTMLWVAVAGLIVNLVVFTILHGADRSNLNIRGATLHVLGDLLGSVAAIAAALIIMTTGWVAADPILSVFVALIILRSAWHLVRQSGHILLEGAPEGVDIKAIALDLIAEVDGLDRVEHIHAWSITPEQPMLTLNAFVKDGHKPDSVNRAIKARLLSRFDIAHSTIELMRQLPDAD